MVLKRRCLHGHESGNVAVVTIVTIIKSAQVCFYNSAKTCMIQVVRYAHQLLEVCL